MEFDSSLVTYHSSLLLRLVTCRSSVLFRLVTRHSSLVTAFPARHLSLVTRHCPSHAHHISLSFSLIMTWFKKLAALVRPSSTDIRLSSCSMDSTSSYPTIWSV